MTAPTATVTGTVDGDGILKLDQKLALPPGRAQVTVVSIPDLPADDPFWQRMQTMWDAQKARGHVPRTTEQVETDRKAIRDEWDERMTRLEQIQAEAKKRSEQP